MDSVAESQSSSTAAVSTHWQARQVATPSDSTTTGALSSGFGCADGEATESADEVELQIIVPASASGGDMLDIAAVTRVLSDPPPQTKTRAPTKLDRAA